MQITGFRSDAQELVLDVDQLPGAVSVNRESGQMSLRGELANGSPIPASVSADKVVTVESVPRDDGHVEVTLAFHGDDGTTITLSLGTTDQADAARVWIDEVKSAVAKRERRPRLNPTVGPGQSVAVPSIHGKNKSRKPTPTQTETSVLVKSRRRCCLCFFWDEDRSQKDGQLAHVDHDPSNCAEENLAYLCLKHHNQYDSRQIQGKNISQQEIKHARSELYRLMGEPSGQRFCVTLVLDRDFATYTDDDQAELVSLITRVLGKNGNVEVKQRSPGSVLLTFTLSGEETVRLMGAVESGMFVNQSIMSVTVAPDEDQVLATGVDADFPGGPPVELPPAKLAIDSDLERELDAAMAGQMTEPTAPPAGASTPSHHQSAVSELPESEDLLEPGTKLKAKVQNVTADDIFCEVGFRSPGLLPARQFPQGKQPRVGEEFLVVVEKYDPENSVILVNLPKATRKAKGNWEELTVGQVVDCMVTKTNKGGLEVNIGPLRAFLPASQVELGFSPALETYVGKKLTVQITEVNPAKRNLVVSRRAILIEERKELAVNFWQQVEVGQQYTGTVKTIKDYGAFIDLGGADGFLHIGEMSWTRVKHPSEVLQEGGQVDVVVLSLDREKQKIGLGMRQLAVNPWAGVEDRYPQGKTVPGRVTRVSDFGAFVELETGVEGLIHISELDHQRVRKVSDVVNVGQEIEAQVLEVLPDRQRISLSLKALKQKPEKPKDEDLSPSQGQQYERKRKEPLRGGTKGDGGGGLFGNPGDYRNK
jgi:small subunit ribosomal protein S1